MQDSTKYQQTDRPPDRQQAETTRSHHRTEQHVVSMRRSARNPSDRRQQVSISSNRPLAVVVRNPTKSRAIAGKSRDAAIGLTFKYVVEI